MRVLFACRGFLYTFCMQTVNQRLQKPAEALEMLISSDFGSLCTGQADVMAPLRPTRSGSSCHQLLVRKIKLNKNTTEKYVS